MSSTFGGQCCGPISTELTETRELTLPPTTTPLQTDGSLVNNVPGSPNLYTGEVVYSSFDYRLSTPVCAVFTALFALSLRESLSPPFPPRVDVSGNCSSSMLTATLFVGQCCLQ